MRAMRPVFLFAIMMSVAGGAAIAAPSPGTPVSKDLQAAADLCYGRDQSNWVAIAQACTTVLEVPNLPKGRKAGAYYNRGTAALHLGGPATALQDFNEALKIEPKFTRALEARGAIYVGQQKFDLAIADLTQAIALDPKSSDAYSNRGMAYMGKNDGTKALADFDKSVSLSPVEGAAFAARGTAYAFLHQNDKAMADFNKAIALDPKLSVGFFNRGKLFMALGDKARAKLDFETALGINPADERSKEALKALEAGG